MTHFLKQHGRGLIAQGYRIVPIREGYKHPKGLNHWQKIDATDKDVDEWIKMGFTGVGIQARTCIGVDLDIYDEKIVQSMHQAVINIVGHDSLVRIGQPPKILLPFRVDVPFRKVQSKVYADWLGYHHKVEMLGDGQQWVAYHNHPDTGKPYKWYFKGKECGEGVGLYKVALSVLPVITEEQAHQIVDAFESMVPDDWTVVPGTKSLLGAKAPVSGGETQRDEPRDGDSFGWEQSKTGKTIEQMHEILKVIPADDYEVMRTVGMGIWFETDGDQEGFELWNEWCQTSAKYTDVDEKQSKWATFQAESGRRAVTFATVLAMAKAIRETAAEKTVDDLTRFVKNYVYVAEGDKVVDLTKPAHLSPIELKSFRNLTAHERMIIKVPAPLKDDPDRWKEKIVPVHEQWLKHPETKKALGFCYEPGAGRVVVIPGGRGAVDVNQFHMAEHKEGMKGDMEPMHRHFKYLFGEDAGWFLDWLAFGIQFPAKRCKVTPLHISYLEGTGRGWIEELIQALVGEWNCTKTQMSTLAGKTGNSGYHEFLHNSLFCFIDEVYEDDKRYAISDRVRGMLTETRFEINLKYGKKGTETICTNFMWSSNHTDALALKEQDRRIAVFECEKEVMPESYYDEMYAWKAQDANVDHLFWWLMDRNVSEFNWKTAPMNDAKRQMIGYGRSDVETAFFEFLEDHPEVEYVTLRRMIDALNVGREFGTEFNNGKDEKQLQKILQKVGKKGPRMRYEGNPVQVWHVKKGVEVDKEITKQGLKIFDDIILACECGSENEKDWMG